MNTFDATEHVRSIPYVGDTATINIGTCPEDDCDYRTGKGFTVKNAAKALDSHYKAKHGGAT